MEKHAPAMPDHIEHGVRATAELGEKHHRQATVYQRAVDQLTATLGKPAVVGLVAVAVLCWLLYNALAPAPQRFDRPPFNALSTVASVAALLMTFLILTTQRRADRLGDQREQLILQLSIVSEKKNSKIIELLELLRKDHPEIKDRIDAEALEMTQTVDPTQVLDKLEHTAAEA